MREANYKFNQKKNNTNMEKNSQHLERQQHVNNKIIIFINTDKICV